MTENQPENRPEQPVPPPPELPTAGPLADLPAAGAPEEQSKRLYCDIMLGKLARELRMRGIDVEYRRGVGGMRAYQTARHHGRVFLTRSGRLRELEAVFFVEGNDPAEQLARVCEKFGLAPGPEVTPEKPEKPERPDDRLNRCLECNVVLEKITRDQARPSIPFFIYQIHSEFTRCPKCKRVYWPGSHAQKMRARLREPAPAPKQDARPERTGQDGNGGRRPRQHRFWRKRHASSTGRQEPQRREDNPGSAPQG